MNVIKTDVLDVYIIEPKVFGDKRGYFFESWSKKKMEDAGLFMILYRIMNPTPL